MSARHNHTPNMKDCICNKCGATARSVPGKVHRRCSGQIDAPIRPKHQGIDPASNRGRWE